MYDKYNKYNNTLAFCKENTTIESEVQFQIHETTTSNSVNSGKFLLCCDVSIVCGVRLQTSSFGILSI